MTDKPLPHSLTTALNCGPPELSRLEEWIESMPEAQVRLCMQFYFLMMRQAMGSVRKLANTAEPGTEVKAIADERLAGLVEWFDGWCDMKNDPDRRMALHELRRLTGMA